MIQQELLCISTNFQSSISINMLFFHEIIPVKYLNRLMVFLVKYLNTLIRLHFRYGLLRISLNCFDYYKYF